MKVCCQEYKDIDLSLMDPVIEDYRRVRGSLIPVLQKVQAVYGWIPEPAVERIALELNIYMSQIYGVVTFYSQFYTAPRGKHLIKICQGTACHVNGSERLNETIQEIIKVKPGETTDDNKVTYEEVACLVCCGLAPVLVVNDSLHGKVKQGQLEEILSNVE